MRILAIALAARPLIVIRVCFSTLLRHFSRREGGRREKVWNLAQLKSESYEESRSRSGVQWVGKGQDGGERKDNMDWRAKRRVVDLQIIISTSKEYSSK